MTENKKHPILDLFRTFWPVTVVIVSVVVNSIVNYTTLGIRLEVVEDRQDRQGAALQTLQQGLQDTQENYAALNEKVDSVKESVDYIRNRIDKALQD